MSNTYYLIGLILLLTQSHLIQAATDCSTVTQISLTECDALIDLYNNTDGPNWIDNTGWNVTNLPCQWKGLKCSGKHVTSLSLRSNNLSGTLPESIANLNSLQYFYIDLSKLNGSIPASIGSLSNLRELYLNANQLSGSIPESIGNLNNLQILFLENNQLTGFIPKSIGNLTSLQYLSLGGNKLSGSIPATLGNLSKLLSFGLDGNQLSGSIPESIGKLNNLNSFFLTENQLSGQIPESIGKLSNLKYIYLNNNQLSGPIPKSIGNLNNLQTLYIRFNQLCGEIPLSLMNLPLSYLDLSHNHLTTSNPDLIKWLNQKNPTWASTQTSCPQDVIGLDNFFISINKGKVQLDWTTLTEINNTGFHLWRAVTDQYGDYKSTLIREFGHFKLVNPEPNENCSTKIQGQLKVDNSNQPPKLISAIGNSTESTCYSFTDTSDLSDGTYYYLLEDIDDDGKSTFHCDQIDAVTVGQAPAIDLESAINYCKEVTGSNN